MTDVYDYVCRAPGCGTRNFLLHHYCSACGAALECDRTQFPLYVVRNRTGERVKGFLNVIAARRYINHLYCYGDKDCYSIYSPVSGVSIG